jgi:glycosyltransferase involved in cell wall biosynthesis
MSKRKPIALITPWFGRELTGGAELHAWNVTCKLAERGFSVEVLTTCCKAHSEDWATNHLEDGITKEKEGFLIRRFQVSERDKIEFDRVCGHLINIDKEILKPGVSPVSEKDEIIFRDQLINTEFLFQFLEENSSNYAAFIFLPYLYGPILKGLPIVASRSILLPCLHDESYAYLHITQNIFYQAKHILWLSEGEYELGLKLYGPGIIKKSLVAGAGIEPDQLSSKTVEIPIGLEPGDSFILTLGRKDRGKGTHFLMDAFREFKKRSESELKLVIAGPGSEKCDDLENGILDLGFVSNELRHWLLENCIALAQPSKNESFSRVIFEAWFLNKPVIARRSCLATACAVQTSKGGWVAEEQEEWVEVLEQLIQRTKKSLKEIGLLGKSYSDRVADWTSVIDRYAEILGPMCKFQSETYTLRITFESLVDQTVNIRMDEDLIGICELNANKVTEFSITTTHHHQRNQILRLETNIDGRVYEPDPRKLGIRIHDLDIENQNAPFTHLIFRKGWNRSEGSGNSPIPRWTTGSAEVLVNFDEQPNTKPSVHQVLPNLGYGDAIGNHAIWIRDRLQAQGFHSDIYARHIAPQMFGETYVYSDPKQIPDNAVLIYHHSIGNEITPWACDHSGPKALIYHNITPPEFFEPYSREFSSFLEQGHNELRLLPKHFPISAGDSKFNATDLKNAGFKNPGVIPLSIDPSKWAYQPDEEVMSQYQDERTNILFVGRVVPNKRHEELIYLFKFWLLEDPTSRLIFVGTNDITSTYLDCLKLLAKKLKVEHAVVFTDHVNNAQLLAYYRCASMFWCLSDHEGFCVPVIEAMWFDIPVVAYDSTAVGGTMGEAGILIKDKSRPDFLAESLYEQLSNPSTVAKVISNQRQRRLHFLPESNGNNIDNLIKTLIRDQKNNTSKT